MGRVVASVAGLWIALWPALAAGREAMATLQHRVDTSNLTRADLLLATLYNDHRLLYAALTTATMAAFGLAIAFAMDALLGQLGLRASKAKRGE